MKATVLHLASSAAGQVLVTLQTAHGLLTGLWQGPLPEVSAPLVVELDFELDADPVAAGESHPIAHSPAPGALELTGQVEEWSDGVLLLRVGSSLVQVETPQAQEHGAWITMRGRDLRIFDANL